MDGSYVQGELVNMQILCVDWSCLDLKHIIGRGKSFAVFAATATEKQEWMAHINKCIEVICSRKPSSEYCSFLKREFT